METKPLALLRYRVERTRIWAMPQAARALTLSGQACLRVLAADAVSITIAAFAALYFIAQMIRGVL